MSNEPDRDPETVELFIEESLEALQRMEQSLLEAEAGRAPKDLMAILFRDIHTLKGSAGFLAFERTQRLAHAAEDLLAKLRDGVIKADATHYAVLLTSGDELRRLLQAIKSTGEEDATEVDATIARLRAAEKNEVPPEQSDTPTIDAPLTSVQEQAVLQEPAEEAVAAARADVSDGTVRVNVGVLDRLMNLIGELVLARNQMVQLVRNRSDATVQSQAACQRLSLVTSDLQEQIMKTRMQPVARVFEKIPRMARDLCNQTGKQAVARIEGTATEIDKALVEAIRDPVMHIVRNAIDHGLEAPEDRVRAGKSAVGQLRVSASHEGGTVVIEVADDGRGMDPKALRTHAVGKGLLTAAAAERLTDREALDLVFRPGFSTAKAVTDISGRGVGMDIVRTHIERAGGQVELDSIVGRGTTIRLKMPLTLAIIPALLVRTGGQRFAIPQVALLELVYVDEEQVESAIEMVRGAPIYRLRGEILPLVNLANVLKLTEQRSGGVNIVVVAVGTRRYGLVVDQIHDTEEIVIKPMQGTLKRLPCYAGATVLGDGGVALILEVAGVASMSGIDISTRRAAESVASMTQRRGGPQPFIVFNAGDRAQCAVPLAMVARLEHLPTKNIERIAGLEVVQYRGSIMPIVRLESLLSIGSSMEFADEQPLIVFDFGQAIALAVNRIVDVVEIDADAVHRQNEGQYALGKTVVAGVTTLVVDVYSVVRELAPQFVQERRKRAERPHVLLADPSAAMRAGLSGFLRAQGVDVTDVATGEAAVATLKSETGRTYRAVIVDASDAEPGKVGGLDVVRYASSEGLGIPAFIWSFESHEEDVAAARMAGAAAVVNKMNREELMRLFDAHGVLSQKRASDENAPGGEWRNRSAA